MFISVFLCRQAPTNGSAFNNVITRDCYARTVLSTKKLGSKHVYVCEVSKLQVINTIIYYHLKGGNSIWRAFTLLIRKNQALYSRILSLWWKHSQF